MKLKNCIELNNTYEKQNNSNYILQNYFAFFDNKLQVSTKYIINI